MKEVIQEAVRLLDEGQPCVLATVVQTKGSTPQKPGAKLLVRQDGSGVGTLGGGCVEGDIWFAAKEIMQRHGGPEYRDYFLNEDIAARDGLVCGGTMYFFIEPLWEPQDFLPHAKEMMNSYEGSDPIGVATVVKTPSGRDNLGHRLLLRSDGSIDGSLGDKKLDQLAIEAAQRMAPLGKNEYVIAEDGTELFVEGFTTPPTLVLMGGGHVGKATSTLANLLGYRIYVVDDRPQFANKERFPEAEETVVADYGEGLDHVPINANTSIVVATRGHRYDDLALEAAIKTPAGYIGLLGSRRKTILIYQRLAQQGVSADRLRDIRAPVGLDIGALTPEELAVSIMSEIIMHHHGKSGSPLTMDDRYFYRAVEKGLATANVSG